MFNSKKKGNMRTVSAGKSNQAVNIDTLISEACQIEGNVNSRQSIKIDGQIEGDVKAEGTVIISSNGVVKGDVSAQSLIVYGSLSGNSNTQIIHIQNGGHIDGNIDTQSLHVEPEATYNGVVSMNKKAAQAKVLDHKQNPALADNNTVKNSAAKNNAVNDNSKKQPVKA